MSDTAFKLLHPKIQHSLYKMKWEELRAIQVDSIRTVLTGHEHIIISAMTSGGKTEAAFLPVLSKILSSGGPGIKALYVGPLKALINDQFRRLEELCCEAEIPVHKWHGDVPGAPKKRMLADPDGVLLITPESLESLFLNHPGELVSLFTNLEFIVIDELHSFIGVERGAHLKSLLNRLLRFSSHRVRKIGLSATLGEPELVNVWLCPHEPGNVVLIRDECGAQKTVKYLVKGYPCGRNPGLGDNWEADCSGLVEDLVKSFYGHTALIFVNSRKYLEFYTDQINRLLEMRKMPNMFRIHHGSLSKTEREAAEEALRSDIPAVTLCSSTLELGIDVGNVAMVGHIGAPWSVNSLVQRLGRSGRRKGAPCVMIVYLTENTPSADSPLVVRLFPQLLQSVAMTELMLEKWCEPPQTNRLHLSALVQQIMSVIAERGGALPEGLFEVLIAKGAFTNVGRRLFAGVLAGLVSSDLIEKTAEGEFILGLKGERIVRSFDFYSSFMTLPEMKVVAGGTFIGTIAWSPGTAPGSLLILSGKRWKILEVDLQKGEILAEPSQGGSIPNFTAVSAIDIHPMIREAMLDVLRSDNIPPYLDRQAAEMLQYARFQARESGLFANNYICERNRIVWFTWSGSRINRTLWALGRYAGLCVELDSIAGISLEFVKTSWEDIGNAYRKLLEDLPPVEKLAQMFPIRAFEKYELYLTEDVQTVLFARNYLDWEGAKELLTRSFH